jgi:DNA repair exonuclease SbcCD ATPase subunit
VERLTQGADARERELADLQARLVSEHEAAELREVQLEAARRMATRVPELEAALARAHAEQEASGGELARVTETLQAEQARAALLERQLADSTANAEALWRERLGQAEAERAALASEREGLQSELTVARAARGRLEGRLAALETASLEAVRYLDASRQREREATEQLTALQPELAGVKARVAELEAEREQLTQAVARLEATPPAQAPESVLDMVEEMEQLQGQCEAYVAELKALREAAETAKVLEASLQSALAERDTRLGELERKLMAQETELGLLRREAARNSADPVQRIYERANAELNAVKSELSRRSTSTGAAPARSPGTPPPVPKPRAAVPALDLPPPPKTDERE